MAAERQIIMLVDDDSTSLAMGKEILDNLYTIYPIPSGAQLFDIMKKVTPDLILLDIDMPEMGGHEVIKRLKSNSAFMDIPVIFLTAYSDPASELEGLSLGAIDYITKPFSAPLLIKRIGNHLLLTSQRKELKRYNQNLRDMVGEQTMEIRSLQNAILRTVSEMVEFRDELSDGHIERVLDYLEILLKAMSAKNIYAEEIADWDFDLVIHAAQMHDVGKIIISEKILNKPEKLNFDEFTEIKKHPVFGLMIVDKIRMATGEHAFLHHAAVIAENHHERWNGTGYPAGLKGAAIPLQGRLMAIADVYDALISLRPYKHPMSPGEAAEEIIRGSGTAFDPALVELFKSVSDDFARVAERHDVLIY